MVSFNFGPNHKSVRRDNNSKKRSEVRIGSVHWFFGS